MAQAQPAGVASAASAASVATDLLCSKCKENPRDRPDTKYTCGWHPHCKACRAKYSQDWYYRNHTARRAQMNAYKAAHPEKEVAYRKRKWKRVRSDPKLHKEFLADQKAWREANPEKLRERERNRPNKAERAAWKRTWEKQKLAIENGKTSPICKLHGFVLLRSDDDRWRAARLDKPWGAGYREYVRFEWMADDARWLVRTPPLGAPDPSLVRRLQRREKPQNGRHTNETTSGS